MKFRLRPIDVEAEQFSPLAKTWPAGIMAQPCYCSAFAQDGRRCELHKKTGRRYGLVRTMRGLVDINAGDWLVTTEKNGLPEHKVMTNETFVAIYEPVVKL
jgi:hypothetical protein